MKSFLLISLISLFAFKNSLTNDSLEVIRDNYPLSVENEELTISMLKKISDENLHTATVIGYKGAYECLMAKHALFPNKKLDYLKKAHISFAASIKVMPNNLEVRLLRYVVEFNTPRYVGFSKNLNEDKLKIFELIRVKNFHADKYQSYLLKVLLNKSTVSEIEKREILSVI